MFLQVPLDRGVYYEMPKIFISPGKVWLPTLALYGLTENPQVHCIHTKNMLEDLSFPQSDTDPYVFISPTVTLFCYCDDCLLLYTSPAVVDILTKQRKECWNPI